MKSIILILALGLTLFVISCETPPLAPVSRGQVVTHGNRCAGVGDLDHACLPDMGASRSP